MDTFVLGQHHNNESPRSTFHMNNSESDQNNATNQITHNKLPLILPKPLPNRNNRLNNHIRNLQKRNSKAKQTIIDNEILQPLSEGLIETEGLEKTFKFTQNEILSNLDSGITKKIFTLNLSYGPYTVESSRNGNHLLIGGRRGQISLLNINTYGCLTDFNVKETIRDLKVLYDYSMYAVAQKKYIYIYDQQGMEIHCMRDNLFTYSLEYLPFHFILASIGEFGELSYDDISTGQVVAKHKTSKGPCYIMRQNPQNANIFLGHTKGIVSTWVPNLSKSAVELLCHKGPITSMDLYQNYLVTSGLDGFWKIWDLRMNKSLHCFKYFGSPPSSIRISHTGIIGLGFGSHIQFWKDSFIQKQKMPYITQDYPGLHISSLSFRPFEDICYIGNSDGVSSILVPGSGIANYDILEENPFETRKQKKEKQIKKLLEKLNPDMISISNKVAILDTSTHESNDQASEKIKLLPKKKTKMRGRGGADSQPRASKNLRLTQIRKLNSNRIHPTPRHTKNSEVHLQSNFGVLNRFKRNLKD